MNLLGKNKLQCDKDINEIKPGCGVKAESMQAMRSGIIVGETGGSLLKMNL